MKNKSSFEGPRPARPDETAGILRFLDRVFPEIAARYSHVYALANEAKGWFHVVTHKGELAAHIGVIPMDFMLPGGGTLKAGGIGAVATDDKFRGKGLMGSMLTYAAKWMKDEGMPISILWGNRRRYARYGWEPAGMHMGFSLEEEALPLLAHYRLPVREVKDARAAGPALARLHAQSGLGVRRKPEHFQHLLKRKGRRTLAAGPAEKPAAFVLGQAHKQDGKANWRVEAMAGSSEGIYSIFRQLLAKGWTVKGVTPLSWRKGWPEFYDMAEGWSSSITGIGQVKVLDLKATLKAYGASSLEKDLRALRLTPMQLPRLLFGPLPPQALLPPGPRRDRLAGKLPLPLFLWPAETV